MQADLPDSRFSRHLRSMATSHPTIAYFVTPHGFGHAARACAVMQAMRLARPDVRFEIFTTVPRWFFAESLSAAFGYHPLETDIGLVQTSSLHEDLPATIRRLSAFHPFDPGLVRQVASHLRELRCSLVVCDIAALGIACAEAAGLPSALVESFTWDWIYTGYLPALEERSEREQLQRVIHYLADWYVRADYHIQTEPVCAPTVADLITPPVGRLRRQTPEATRESLGIPHSARVVLLTMGGVPWSYGFVDRLTHHPDTCFVIPGGGDRRERNGNVLMLPRQSGWYHPDLIAASDGVVGKVGYSTLAEVYQAGKPFGYVLRPRFP
ncbi:MAG: hypothetical protein D6775_10080, partial [Caldilineae bacterium]